MRLLFIQGGSRLKLSDTGRWFTDSNFTSEIWERYMSVSDHLTVVLRRENKIYSVQVAVECFNPIPDSPQINVIPLDDISVPKWNMINPVVRRRIKDQIREAVSNCDKAIIRSCSYYTVLCQEECLRQGKPYLLEVAGLIKEGYWFHSISGKIVADYFERKFKQMAFHASHCIYVTEEALQQRYPSQGKMLGCSDVQLNSFDDSVLENRIGRYSNQIDKIVLGTAAFLDVRWKGQENVIKAIALLRDRGIDNIYYELIGMGKGIRLRKLVKKLNLEDRVSFIGALPHSQVFEWYNKIDVYVQSSYQEGLCRSIVEAMSCACPVICSNIGGNYELVERDYIFECGDYNALSLLIEKMGSNLIDQAKRNYEHSHKYAKPILDAKRNSFLLDFIES